jgi:hypothetical protein
MMQRVVVMSALVPAVIVMAADAGAQEGSVSLPFDGRSLRVEVVAAAGAGDVEIVDGVPGAIQLADAAGGSVVALESGVLSLNNRSAGRVDYRISVPPGTNVALSVNGRPVLAMVAAGGGRHMVWRWPVQGSSVAAAAPGPSPPPRPRRSFAVNAFIGPAVVDSADVAYPGRIAMLKVIVGGERFSVIGDRSVAFGYHKPTRWGVVTPRADSVEVTIEIPAELRDFRIRIGDSVVWEMVDGVGKAYCDPVAEIERPDGRTLWSFTPIAGQLSCPPRREASAIGDVAMSASGGP